MKLFRVLFRFSRASAIFAIVVGALAGLASTAVLAMLNEIINRPRPHEAYDLILPFIGLAVLVALSRVGSGYLMERIGQRAIFDLRMRLCRSMLDTPLDRLEALGSHRLLAALTTDIQTVTIAIRSVPMFCTQAAIVAGALAYLGWLSWQGLILVVVLMPLGSLGYLGLLRYGMREQRKARDVSDELHEHYRGVTHGIKELQLHARRRGEFLDRLEVTGDVFRRIRLRAMVLFRTAASSGQFLFFLVIGSVVFLLPRLQAVGGEVTTGFVLVLLYIINPLQSVLNTLPDLSNANVSVEKIDQLGLSLLQETRSLPATARREDIQPVGTLELDRVEYTYDRDDGQGFHLGPVSLSLEAGEAVFLTGGNGSGKTTLAKTLVGLYEPTGGSIRLDGRPVGEGDREWYRQHVSAIFSDYFLFTHLLGLSNGADGDEAAHRMLARLQLDHKVEVEDGRFTTIDLSQGQRKRLALLATLLEDRPIYLFDEWAADQDPSFKAFFYRELIPELKRRGKIVLVISHDDHYYETADRVVKMDYGKIEWSRRPEVSSSWATTLER